LSWPEFLVSVAVNCHRIVPFLSRFLIPRLPAGRSESADAGGVRIRACLSSSFVARWDGPRLPFQLIGLQRVRSAGRGVPAQEPTGLFTSWSGTATQYAHLSERRI